MLLKLLVCLISAVLVNALTEDCKELARKFPEKCNQLNSAFKTGSVTCKQCAQNITGMEQIHTDVVAFYTAQIQRFYRNWQPIIKKLIRQYNNRVKIGPIRCQHLFIPNVPYKYILPISEICDSNISYVKTEEIKKALKRVESGTTIPLDENETKCVCSYAVPYLNAASQNFKMKSNAIKSCNIDAVFKKMYIPKWRKCIREAGKGKEQFWD